MKNQLFSCGADRCAFNLIEVATLCSEPAALLLSRFTDMSRTVLGDSLLGIYLHGSAAMGCFNPRKSDLDLILVTDTALSHGTKLEFMANTVTLNKEAPKKGMELSIVRKEFCRPFVYPTPFELHFSVAHLERYQKDPDEYIRTMQGTDKDLAAHFTIINRYGIPLSGPPVPQVFGPVPKEAYLDSILLDVENAREDILAAPVYTVLNLCRVLAYLQEDLVLSKKAGGERGLRTLPEKFHGFLQAMLKSYLSEEDDGNPPEPDLAADFADYMLTEIRKTTPKPHPAQ